MPLITELFEKLFEPRILMQKIVVGVQGLPPLPWGGLGGQDPGGAKGGKARDSARRLLLAQIDLQVRFHFFFTFFLISSDLSCQAII